MILAIFDEGVGTIFERWDKFKLVNDVKIALQNK